MMNRLCITALLSCFLICCDKRNDSTVSLKEADEPLIKAGNQSAELPLDPIQDEPSDPEIHEDPEQPVEGVTILSRPSFIRRSMPYGVVSYGHGRTGPARRTFLSLTKGEKSLSIPVPETLPSLLDLQEEYVFRLSRSPRLGYRLDNVQKDGVTVYAKAAK